MARAGLCSRREAEAWIAAGRVAVNGKAIASPALNVAAHDRITVDGEPLPARERTRLFLFHKPRGLIDDAIADPQGRPTIFAALPHDLPRLISVGRLDLNTEGLLLLTNDGALARVLELPATGWLRRYRVRAHGGVTPAAARYAAQRHHHQRHPLRCDRGRARPRAGRKFVAHLCDPRGQEPRSAERARPPRAHGQSPDPRVVRPVPARRTAEGAVEEVATRILRDQLGDRIIAQSGADFSSARVDKRAAGTQGAARGQRPQGRASRLARAC